MNRTQRVLLAAVGLPLLLAVAATALAQTWRDRLPDPVATHWGASGVPDGFTSVQWAVWQPLFLGLIPVLVGVLIWAATRRVPSQQRIAAGFATGLAVFLAVVSTGTLFVQRDIATAASVRDVGGVLLVGVLAAVPVGLLAGWLVPPAPLVPAHGMVPADAPRADLPPGARAVWVGHATNTRVTLGFGLGLLLLAVILTAASGGTWWFLLLMLVPAALVTAFSSFTVTVGDGGVTARGLLGWPRVHVPMGEIESASVGEVSPMRDFGGWGYRFASDGRYGVVVRAGESLLVHKGDGSTFVATVEQAREAASVLNTLVERARARR